jgi:hypothetical protein
MSLVAKIPRSLRVLIAIAVLAILVWQFAFGTAYFYYSVGAAFLITFGVTVLVYRPFKFSKSMKTSETFVRPAPTKNMTESGLPEKIEIESDYTDTPSIMRNKPVTPFKEAVGKPADLQTDRATHSSYKSIIEQSMPLTSPLTGLVRQDNVVETEASTEAVSHNSADIPSIPLVEDESSLTDEDKNQLVNAVWYRCENPYCKYTSFLGVHHIVDEKDGGTNRLDNLIVLCPYCHDLAHRKEIPLAEMHEWINNRENRFKNKPDWKYF